MKCLEFLPSCILCNDINNCLKCENYFYLNPSHQCKSTCPEGYYKNFSSFTCDPCKIPYCSNCIINRENCTNCSEGTLLINNISVIVVLIPFVLIVKLLEDKICDICQDGYALNAMKK